MEIEQIEKLKVIGNSFHDRKILNECHEIIMNLMKPMSDKIRAMKVIDITMGVLDDLDESEFIEKVNRYIEMFSC